MPDPIASIAAEAETGTTPTVAGPDGAPIEKPRFSDRFIELIKPCPEDPAEHAGFISRQVNGFLSRRTGVPEDHIDVGENLAHCVNHLFPGGSGGLPPLAGLAMSLFAFRMEARKLREPAPTATP